MWVDLTHVYLPIYTASVCVMWCASVDSSVCMGCVSVLHDLVLPSQHDTCGLHAGSARMLVNDGWHSCSPDYRRSVSGAGQAYLPGSHCRSAMQGMRTTWSSQGLTAPVHTKAHRGIEGDQPRHTCMHCMHQHVLLAYGLLYLAACSVCLAAINRG